MRYQNDGLAMHMAINNNYTISAIYNKADDTHYSLTLYINRNDIDLLDKIDTQMITSAKEKIKSHIALIVETAYKNGFLQEYIDRYERMVKAFDLGNDILEREELGTA